MSQPQEWPRPTHPDESSMSGALPYIPPQPMAPQHSGIEAQMPGPAAYDDQRPQGPQPSPYVGGTDPFRPQRASPSPGRHHPASGVPSQDIAATPAMPMTPHFSSRGPDLKTARAASHAAVREFVDLVRRRQGAPPGSTISVDIEGKIRAQGAIVFDDLRMLREELREVARAKEGHRWRKWVVGGAVASFIPAVKSMFRHFVPPSTEVTHASNDTEYAFRRSASLLARIRESVLGRGGVLAGVSFFVFAVLYVFQNEVAIRVARTLSRRVKKLLGKLEKGGYEVDEGDLNVFEGWRWRVLL
ncbi:uncharacterized protein DNG_04145 [Cephalotrichum gorgonifer]|uniref:Uncharacterized protein n=1 Tax=Cephalotrichum gorgonifer TaxID=2041049 RepID=A0AAE8MWG8_9PEZI|nr:uncharacterized protein DNG_04145 [Cephalotrichum gorgonifer]